mmetsp:Transcript_239/g.659  ORF Transcript_239/g.659 Transcript_239/m.659 type:complete len:303 (+) Transcript_239:161-1069(+)
MLGCVVGRKVLRIRIEEGDRLAGVLARHGVVQILPPLEATALHDALEPRRPQQIGLLQHLFHFRDRQVLALRDFIRIDLHCGLLDLQKDDVIDFVLAPRRGVAVRDGVGRPVMEPVDEPHVLHRQLIGSDAQFLLQFAHGGIADALHFWVRLRQHVDLVWCHAMQGMRAACVSPHAREGDLAVGAFGEEHLALRVEEEEGEGAVQDAARRIVAERVRLLLGAVHTLDQHVILIDHDQHVRLHHGLLIHVRAVGLSFAQCRRCWAYLLWWTVCVCVCVWSMPLTDSARVLRNGWLECLAGADA